MKEVTILVHGFNKDKTDMIYLEHGLKLAGHEVLSVNLPTTFSSLNQCKNSLHLQVKNIINNAEFINYVGHSMGGLIIRSFIANEMQRNVGKCVFIATPHGGSKLAEIADCIPFYSKVFKPIKGLLPKSDYVSFEKGKNFKIGIIAGSENSGGLGKLFLSKESDGRVEISSVKAVDMDDFVIVPYGHDVIHHENETLVLVDNFLRNGVFKNFNII